MSYDSISNILSSVGGGLESFGKGAANTLLGQTPRTDSVTNFTGDTLSGITDPHGLLGQIARVAAVAGAFGKGVGPGMQVLDMISKDDQQKGQDASFAAANNMDPDQFEQYFGYRPRGNVPVGPKDMPNMTGEGGMMPSQPNQVIKSFASPEEMIKAQQAEMIRARQSPSFGKGMNQQQLADMAAQEQRNKLPSDFRTKNAATAEAMPELKPGTTRQTISVQPGGDIAFHAVGLPPEDQSMTLEDYNAIKTPPGINKFSIPDETNPGLVKALYRTDKGDTILDVYKAAGAGDPSAQNTLDKLMETAQGKKLPPRPGSFGDYFEKLATQNNIDPKDVPAGTQAKLEAAWLGARKAATQTGAFAGMGMKPDELRKVGEDNFKMDMGLIPNPKELADKARTEELLKGPVGTTPVIERAGKAVADVLGGPMDTSQGNAPPVRPAPLAQKPNRPGVQKAQEQLGAVLPQISSLAKTNPSQGGKLAGKSLRNMGVSGDEAKGMLLRIMQMGDIKDPAFLEAALQEIEPTQPQITPGPQ